MMLGIAANSSTAVPTNPFRKAGHNSDRKTAIPIPIGAATETAIREVRIEPRSGRAAPNRDSA